jgi:hypothetical protein
LVRRQGPIAQFLQQRPSAPMGQGFIASARLKAVETSWHSGRSRTSIAAGSTLLFFSVIFDAYVLSVKVMGNLCFMQAHMKIGCTAAPLGEVSAHALPV